MEYTDKLLRDALFVAEKAHKNQTYDGIFPYMKHIYDVIDVLKRFDFKSNKLLIGAALHDSIEDDGISYNDIKKHFGVEVAEMVYCVTDELGRNRKEKKEKTLPKTTSNPDAIILKLADRIANIEHGGKVDMYSKEYQEFKGSLYLNTPSDGKSMWEHLDKLMGVKVEIETV
jgi:guanosine-3',5'-bis(diphosphate) 3'-pyrophosphohydrolase